MLNPIINFNPNILNQKTVTKPEINEVAQTPISTSIKKPKLPQPTTLMALLYNNISFTGKKEDLVRSFGNVSCPCCGVKMLTNKDMNRIQNNLGKENSAKHYIKTLTPYEEYMHKAEKGVFNKFKEWGKENPKGTLQDFVSTSRESSLEVCRQKKDETLIQISKLANDITPELGKKFNHLTDIYTKMPFNTEEDMKTLRKYMLSDVENSENSIENKETYKKLRNLADNLPISKNNEDAFIVRYAGNPSSKIGHRLLKLSVGTIEHIKPQADGGRDRVENYLLECGECNHTRGDISLKEWVEDHPEMKENTQKYFDEVIEKINNNEVSSELDNYPNSVRGALKEQSKGTLTYDTSALKPKEKPNKGSNNKPNKPNKPRKLNLAA